MTERIVEDGFESTLLDLAIKVGKAKMVLEVKERCFYPDARQEEAHARVQYEIVRNEFLDRLEEYYNFARHG